MSLITDGYLAMQREFHVKRDDYGIVGQNYVTQVRDLCRRFGTYDVLDYGCGKRTLERALGFEIQNYDPAIPGLDAPPIPADILVCTDVLEHIEPECLDAVLADLNRVTKRCIFVAVSTVAAIKTLDDGRNAHLLQQPLEWWQPKLEQYFRMSRVWGYPTGFVFIGQSLRDRANIPDLEKIGPPPTLRRVVMKSVFTNEQRCENIRSAMLRGLKSVPIVPAHDNTMVLVGYGPTLGEHITEIRRTKGDVFTTSGAHRMLLDNGIVPTGHLESDPRDHKAVGFGKPDPRVVYFLASAASRKTFDAVHGFETWLFHVTSSAMESTLIQSMDPNAFTIDGGTNSGMMLIGLGTVLGYRKFEIFGMDCSFKCDDTLLRWPKDEPMPADTRERVKFHAGLHPNDDQDLYRVWIGDRPFLSSPQLFQSAQDFMSLSASSRCRFTLHGDGFLRNLVSHIESLKMKKAA